ncbi:hypothetical protein [Demequina sp. NBRC 110055]|uniref:hypothetical protein n=1 Tax=Demequina sp. NBRC 110055 TaxID=1570344 RepID=UPI0011859473|nr:hypothetical protein [Demequina sp. NBRC 110055]
MLGKLKALLLRNEVFTDSTVRLSIAVLSGVLTLGSSWLVIGALGPSAFALVTLIWSTVLLLPFADLGVGAAVTNVISASSNAYNSRIVTLTVAAAARKLTFVAAVIVLAAALLPAVSDHVPQLQVRVPGMPGVTGGVALTLVLFAINLPLSLWKRILLGAGKNRVLIAIGTTNAPVTAAIAVATVYFSLHPIILIAAPSVGALLASAIGLSYASRRRLVNLRSIATTATSKLKTRGINLWHTGAPMLIVLVATPILTQSDRYILAITQTPAALASYSLAAQLYAPLLAALTAGGASLWPKFSRARAAGLPARPILVQAYKQTAVLGSVAAIGLISIGPPLLKTIGQGEVNVTYGLLGAFCTLILVQAITIPAGMLLTDARGLRAQAVTAVIALTVKIILATHLVALGPAAPVLATAVALFIFQSIPLTTLAVRRTVATR